MSQLAISYQEAKEYLHVTHTPEGLEVVREVHLTVNELEQFINSLDILDELHTVDRIGHITCSKKLDLTTLK